MSAKKWLALRSWTLVLSRWWLWKRELNIRDSEKRVNFRNVCLNHSDWFYDSEWELFEIPWNDIFNRKNPYDLPKWCSLYIEVTSDTKLVSSNNRRWFELENAKYYNVDDLKDELKMNQWRDIEVLAETWIWRPAKFITTFRDKVIYEGKFWEIYAVNTEYRDPVPKLELTIDQIAEKFWVDPDNIIIK